MAKSTRILVATAQIATGIVPKGQAAPIVIEAEEELTPALAKALGLKEDDLEAWKEKGLLRAVKVRVAAADETAAAIARAEKAEAALAAEKTRADKAEAELAALRKQVEDEKKGGASAGGGADARPAT